MRLENWPNAAGQPPNAHSMTLGGVAIKHGERSNKKRIVSLKELTRVECESKTSRVAQGILLSGTFFPSQQCGDYATATGIPNLE